MPAQCMAKRAKPKPPIHGETRSSSASTKITLCSSVTNIHSFLATVSIASNPLVMRMGNGPRTKKVEPTTIKTTPRILRRSRRGPRCVSSDSNRRIYCSLSCAICAIEPTRRLALRLIFSYKHGVVLLSDAMLSFCYKSF